MHNKHYNNYDKHYGLMLSLGINPNKNVDVSSIPDYLDIALGWYSRHEKTGEAFAYLNFQHYLRVAEEFKMCSVDAAITNGD